MAWTVEEVQVTLGAPDASAVRRWLRRLPDAAAPLLIGTRPRRVVLGVIAVCVLNAFDLGFTLIARHHEFFWEVNPLARGMLDSAAALVAFKATLVAFGAGVIVRYRRHRLAEVGCWCVCALYALLTGVWWSFYELAA